METSREDLIQKAVQYIQDATKPIALTGAGISVASGIPDFRSPGGLWSKYDPNEVCSSWALKNNPGGVWEFLFEAVDIFSTAEPNPAHSALAVLEREGYVKGIITQNIDNLHQRAGSQNVIEFHGNCHRFYCMGCGLEYPASDALNLKKEQLPWLCSKCNGLIRPDVVFFGESIPPSALIDTQNLVMHSDLMLIIGTSGEVAPANTFALHIKSGGGVIIEINLGATTYERLSDVRIQEKGEVVLPQLVQALVGGAG